MKPVVKTAKEITCSLCGKPIKKGKLRFRIKDEITKERLNCHIGCFNVVHKMCSDCNECKDGYKKCFDNKTRMCSIDEVMEAIKFFFDGISRVKYVHIIENTAVFYYYDDRIAGEINLKNFFGENVVIPEEQYVYRDWYKEND